MAKRMVAEKTEAEARYLGLMAQTGVPEHLRDGLVLYLVHQIQPGSFMLAVLSNDLKEAFSRADETSRAGMFELVKFLYNHAPFSAWGSPDRVQDWLTRGAK